MFSKISRYRKLDDDVIQDINGYTIESKSIRIIPEVSGIFSHAVAEGERLDHLGYKYYKQSKKWWRICDANPEFRSPLALLGHEPLIQIKVPIIWEGYTPQWSELIVKLLDVVGIKQAFLGSSETPSPILKYRDTILLFDIIETLTLELNNSVLNQTLSEPLKLAMEAKGVSFGEELRFFSISDKKWRIADHSNKITYAFKHEDAKIDVYQSTLRHHWEVILVYNKMNIDEKTVKDKISSEGFEVSGAETINRVGKKITIPSNITT